MAFSAPVLSELVCLKFCAMLTAYPVVEMDCDTEYGLFSTKTSRVSLGMPRKSDDGAVYRHSRGASGEADQSAAKCQSALQGHGREARVGLPARVTSPAIVFPGRYWRLALAYA